MHLKELCFPNTINLVGTIGPEMVKSLDQQAKELLSDSQELPERLIIRISSGGGNIASSRELHERIRILDATVPVSIVAIGTCMSAAVVILVSVPQERRFSTKHTRFLIHQPATDSREMPAATLEIRQRRLEDLCIDADELARSADWAYGLMAKASGKRKRDIKAMAVPGTFMSAKEAMELGLVSELLV